MFSFPSPTGKGATGEGAKLRANQLFVSLFAVVSDNEDQKVRSQAGPHPTLSRVTTYFAHASRVGQPGGLQESSRWSQRPPERNPVDPRHPLKGCKTSHFLDRKSWHPFQGAPNQIPFSGGLRPPATISQPFGLPQTRFTSGQRRRFRYRRCCRIRPPSRSHSNRKAGTGTCPDFRGHR